MVRLKQIVLSHHAALDYNLVLLQAKALLVFSVFQGVDSEPVHVDSIPEPLLISLVRLLNKQSTRRIVHARAAITLRLCKNVMRNMPAVASASSGNLTTFNTFSVSQPGSSVFTGGQLFLRGH